MMRGIETLNCLLVVIAIFKSAHGIQCRSCAYYKFGDQEFGLSNCKAGKFLPAEMCSESSVIPTSAVIPGIQKVRRLGDVRLMMVVGENRNGLAESINNKTHYQYGCNQNVVVGRVNGHPFSLVSRSCTFSPEKWSVCNKGSKEELSLLGSLIPADAQLQLDDFVTCVCFEDKCNLGAMATLSGIINLVWISVTYYGT